MLKTGIISEVLKVEGLLSLTKLLLLLLLLLRKALLLLLREILKLLLLLLLRLSSLLLVSKLVQRISELRRIEECINAVDERLEERA